MTEKGRKPETRVDVDMLMFVVVCEMKCENCQTLRKDIAAMTQTARSKCYNRRHLVQEGN